MKQYFKEFVHNAIVHPLMMFMPRALANHMHDVNARWAFGSNRFDEIGIEEGMKSLGGNNDNTPSTTHSITTAELERLRKDADAPSSVEWPKHWVDQHVEPKTLHKPVLVPLEVLIRTEFELTHSERGGDYDTKILGILRDIIAQADDAIAAEGEKG